MSDTKSPRLSIQQYDQRPPGSGSAALVAETNHVQNAVAGGFAAAGAFRTVVTATIIPILSGKFRVSYSSYGTPTITGLTTAQMRLFDGTSVVGGVISNLAGMDSGSTPSTRTVGGAQTFDAGVGGISTPAYAIGTPVTFSVQIDPEQTSPPPGQGYNNQLATIVVQELPG